MKDKLKIGIVGASSEGKALAVFLGAKHYDVELVYENSNHIQIGEGVVMDVVGVWGSKSYLVPCVPNVKHFTSKKDIIFVMSRAYDTAKLTNEAKAGLTSSGIIVAKTNMLNYDDVREVFDDSRLVGVFLEWSALTIDHQVAVNNDGNMTIGVFNEIATKYLPIVQSVLNEVSQTFATKNMSGFILSRTIMNIAIASLGAITGMTLGKILEKRQGKKLFVKIIAECLEVCDKMGIKVYAYNNKLDYRKFVENSFESKKYRFIMLRRIRIQNSEIRSSLLQSIELNKKSEMDYSIGKMVVYSVAYGVEAKVCTRIYKMLKDIEALNLDAMESNLYDEKLTFALCKK